MNKQAELWTKALHHTCAQDSGIMASYSSCSRRAQICLCRQPQLNFCLSTSRRLIYRSIAVKYQLKSMRNWYSGFIQLFYHSFQWPTPKSKLRQKWGKNWANCKQSTSSTSQRQSWKITQCTHIICVSHYRSCIIQLESSRLEKFRGRG